MKFPFRYDPYETTLWRIVLQVLCVIASFIGFMNWVPWSRALSPTDYAVTYSQKVPVTWRADINQHGKPFECPYGTPKDRPMLFLFYICLSPLEESWRFHWSAVSGNRTSNLQRSSCRYEAIPGGFSRIYGHQDPKKIRLRRPSCVLVAEWVSAKRHQPLECSTYANANMGP